MNNIFINKMISNCVHLGHKNKFNNKLMKPYILNIKNSELSIINLQKTENAFKKVLNIISQLSFLNKTILIVCTKKYTKNIIRAAAKSVNMPFVVQRWLGGTLTNFESLKNSIIKMNYRKFLILNYKIFKLKKRILYINIKRYRRSKNLLEGIMKLVKNPDFIFTIDSRHHRNLILESNKMGIPIACVVDTNNSPLNIDYVIPGNDDSLKSISFYIKNVVKAINYGKNKLIKYNL